MNAQTQKVLDYLKSEELAGPLADQIGSIYDSEIAQARQNAILKAMEVLRPTVQALLPNAKTDDLIKELAREMMPTGLH